MLNDSVYTPCSELACDTLCVAPRESLTLFSSLLHPWSLVTSVGHILSDAFTTSMAGCSQICRSWFSHPSPRCYVWAIASRVRRWDCGPIGGVENWGCAMEEGSQNVECRTGNVECRSSERVRAPLARGPTDVTRDHGWGEERRGSRRGSRRDAEAAERIPRHRDARVGLGRGGRWRARSGVRESVAVWLGLAESVVVLD